MITIAHVSDTHDKPSLVRQACQAGVDVVLITGDCMNNAGRNSRTGEGIIAHKERKYQQTWYRKQAKKWAADAAAHGNPVFITVRGNHDFIDYGRWLRHYGATVYEITDTNPMVEVLGLKWSGFRQVPYLEGEWAGERDDFSNILDNVFATNPDVLLTHAPPGGILDENKHGLGYGIPALTSRLAYTPHKVTHHFYGHAHEGLGSRDEMGIKFYNGAGACRIHTID